MNRLLLGIGILGAAAVLGGCPIYSGQSNEYRVCGNSSCYSCPDPTYSGACISWQCNSNSDCDSGYECTSDNQCVLAAVDASGPIGPTDCSVDGCPSGYVCRLAGGVASCVTAPEAGSVLDSGAGPVLDSGVADADGGATATDSVAPEGSVITGPCNADSDCHGSGEKCIDGTCTPQVGLCSDGTQCAVAGSWCVDGVCEPTCSASTPCPSGYGCDFTRGVCNLDSGGCSGSGPSTCQGGATCVDGHCVPPCSADGGSCATGQVCVNGGCIPDQAATFACANDGDQGQLANSCADGFTCLHHDCYPACSVDSGACATPSAATCKNVAIETGTYAVCAAPGTLGSECDPAQGKYCSGSSVCINGSCL